MEKNPIGIFDSGYGGLTVLKDICATLPQYDYIYLGDNHRAPYGPLPYKTVYEYTLQCMNWFFDKGCTLVILACNTASAKALRTIQQNDLEKIDLTKRVLGVIRPTSEIIGEYTKTNHVGVMATQGTVDSRSYLLEIEKFFPGMAVSQEACPGWVALVENGKHESPEADANVKLHINNLLEKDREIDSILLACTHYPLLLKKIKQFVPPHISVIQQGNIVADSLLKFLTNHPETEERCSKNGKITFYTTGDPDDFNSKASVFFKQKVEAAPVKL